MLPHDGEVVVLEHGGLGVWDVGFAALENAQPAKGRDPFRPAQSHEPTHHVEHVDSHVSDGAVAVFHELPPVALDIGAVGHHRRGTDPEVPVQRVGHGRRLRGGRLAPAVGIDLHVSDDAEFPLLYEVARLDQMRSAAPLRAHLDHPLILTGRRQHRLPFHYIHADRLLQVHIGAGLRGLDHRQGMPVIRRGDLHQVQVFLFEHLAIVGEHPRFLFGGLAHRHHVRAVGHHLPIDIAQRHNLDRSHLDQPEDIGFGIPAATDDSHPFGRRIRGLGAVSAGGRQRQPGNTRLHEFTTVHRIPPGFPSARRPVYPNSMSSG